MYRRAFPAMRLEPVGLESFTTAFETMLAALAARVPPVRAAVVTMPPIGEDLGDASNLEVRRYNDVLKRLVLQHNADSAVHNTDTVVRVIDFHAACVKYLQAQPGRIPPPRREPSWWGIARTLLVVGVQRFLLGWGWDRVSRHAGLQLTTDQVGGGWGGG